MRMLIQSLASFSGLWTWCHHDLWYKVTDMAWILHCCGCGVGPAAVALIQLLAWEVPCTTGAALKRQKKNFFLKRKKESRSGKYTSPSHAQRKTSLLSLVNICDNHCEEQACLLIGEEKLFT